MGGFYTGRWLGHPGCNPRGSLLGHRRAALNPLGLVGGGRARCVLTPSACQGAATAPRSCPGPRELVRRRPVVPSSPGAQSQGAGPKMQRHLRHAGAEKRGQCVRRRIRVLLAEVRRRVYFSVFVLIASTFLGSLLMVTIPILSFAFPGHGVVFTASFLLSHKGNDTTPSPSRG